MVKIITRCSTRTLTTVSIDVKLKELAKRHGLCLSKILQDAVKERIRIIDSGVNDFAGPTLESDQTKETVGDSSLVLKLDKDADKRGYHGQEAN